jgi:hypothetical protein
MDTFDEKTRAVKSRATVPLSILPEIFLKRFQGSLSREEYKTSSSVLTTVELSLPVVFTKSCNQRAPCNELRNLIRAG